MADRNELVRRAFAALDTGDVAPFMALFAPDAKWVAIPQGGETPSCENRTAIVDRLAHHHANGRRFQLRRLIEQGDRIAVETTVLAPEWSGPVTLFKVFTFQPDEDVVVQLNDCIDESYALQMLAA